MIAEKSEALVCFSLINSLSFRKQKPRDLLLISLLVNPLLSLCVLEFRLDTGWAHDIADDGEFFFKHLRLWITLLLPYYSPYPG